MNKSKKLTALLLTLTLTMSGCINTKKNKNNDVNQISFDIYKDRENMHNYIKNLEKIKEEKQIKRNQLEEYIKEIESINPVYNHEEFYPTIEDIRSFVETEVSFENCTNEDTDIEELISQIVQNSEEFANLNNFLEMESAFNCNLYEELDSEKLGESIKNAIRSSLSSDNEDLLKEDICKMKDLKIVFYEIKDINSIVFINKDYMIINKDNLTSAYDKYCDNASKYPDLYEEIPTIYSFVEERIIPMSINSFLSSGCIHNNYNSAIIHHFGNSNDVVGTSIIESSNESRLYKDKIDEVKSFSYEYEGVRKIEGLYFLLSIFTDKEINDYYDSIREGNERKLHEFYGLNDEYDYYKFYKSLYGMEARINKNLFKQKLFKSGFELDAENACYIDFYALFLKKLMTYSLENNISLEDNLTLNRLARGIILSEAPCILGEDLNFYWDDEFKTKLKELNKIYEKFIKTKYNISDEHLLMILEERVQPRNRNLNHYKYNNMTNEDKIIDNYPIIRNIIRLSDCSYSEYTNELFDEEINKKIKTGNYAKKYVISKLVY